MVAASAEIAAEFSRRFLISAVSAHAGLMPAAPAAGVLLTEFRQPTLAESLHGFSNRSGRAAMVNLNAHLLKPHERSHAHSTGEQNADPVLSQMADRPHTSPLLVRNVGNDVDGGNPSFVEGDKSVKVAVPEMGPQNGIQASRKFGRHGNDGSGAH
jgi:hypothetical protein